MVEESMGEVKMQSLSFLQLPLSQPPEQVQKRNIYAGQKWKGR